MSKKEDVDELRARMESIRKERQKLKQPSLVSSPETLTRTHQFVMPIVESFVKQDRSLSIQYSDYQNIFIAYGYARVCRLVFEMHGNEVEIALQDEAGQQRNLYSSDFSDENFEQRVKESVKAGLLQWYTSLF